MINTLLKKISKSCQEKDWQAISDIDKQLKQTIERSMAKSAKKPESAKSLMNELEQVTNAYNELLLACNEEKNHLEKQAHNFNKGQKASQRYLSIAE